ncbi:MAG: hypothetical protein ABIA93_07645 [Candidatus Woesearchaeota archaeon]
MLFTFHEILDVLIMTIGLGFIFMNYVPAPKRENKWKDLPYNFNNTRRFDWRQMWFAALLVAPAIILHELGHKFVALTFGLQATFHAAYTWLGIGVLLRLLNFGFIFFVPAYVSIAGNTAPINHALIAFAGPAVHLILFVVSILVLKKKGLRQNSFMAWTLIKRINLTLFILNMLPIPLFDGWTVYTGLYHTLF